MFVYSMHVKILVPRLMPEALDALSSVSRIDRKRGAKGGEGEMRCACAVLSGWRETTPAVETADNPAYDNNRVR